MRPLVKLSGLLAVLSLLATAAPARASETSGKFANLSVANKVGFHTGETAITSPATTRRIWAFKSGGRLFDVVCNQITAGTTGTSIQVDVQKNGTTMLSTLMTIPLSGGANAKVDMAGNIAAISGAVRPKAATVVAAQRVAKGDVVTIVTTETGGYGTHPTYECEVVFTPDM